MDNKNVKAKRRAYGIVMRGLSGLCALLTAALVLFLIAYVLIRGIPNISWEFLSTKPSYLADSVGILPDILNTLYIVLGTLVWVLPLGVGAAIYLTEYASNHRIVGAIEYAAETLSGIPSIIYGLVGMLFFCNFLGFQTSLQAGALIAAFGSADAVVTFVVLPLAFLMLTVIYSAYWPMYASLFEDVR